MQLNEFYEAIQKACLPGIWSKGVNLARLNSVIVDSNTPDELVLRIQSPDRPVSQKVRLWPEDEDWFCDCSDKNDVCGHVAAAVVFLKTNQAKIQNAEVSSVKKVPQLIYRFIREKNSLTLKRWIDLEPLSGSLVSYTGGIQSGRINSKTLAATKEDYAVDLLLSQSDGVFNRSTWPKLFKALSECSNLFLDEKSVKIISRPLQYELNSDSEAHGSKIQFIGISESAITEVFDNGVALCGADLRALELLEVKPVFKKVPPRMRIKTDRDPATGDLIVVPTLYYGNSPDEKYIRDPVAEKFLIRKLQDELQLTQGSHVRFSGEAAIEFVHRLKSWETSGPGIESFRLESPLEAALSIQGERVSVSFNTSTESQNPKGIGGADPHQVFKAWKSNQNYVPLLQGGWAPLPKDWLNRYGNRILQLMEQKDSEKSLQPFELPTLIQLCDELNVSYSDSLRNLKERLSSIDKIEEASLPQDLTADLRKYQRVGINWLRFLESAGMGALLADDMGLGKTLQALCAIQGRTLIVTPTSVLKTWSNQISQFRPQLTQSTYYGTLRKLNSESQVTLTTYAILRLDRELLADQKWDTVVLDEAHTIKNPESQVAKAAHSLTGQFRIALSGTPVENHLLDLWSQFQFLNPGLLGTKDDFDENFAQPIGRGSREIAQQLRTRVKPFILRRLKKEVAPELPPRTETVLYCELSTEERDVYDSILASARKDVIEKLEMTSNVFSALELLLRLRQACCHISLIPGQKSEKSSKLELLVQTLIESIEAGHRALVFSQWTSYLDLIEPELNAQGISFLRLDGSTKNRAEIVEKFQTQSEIAVLLISLKAGGVGITLTAADHIFLMDPWWNPAIEDQAADRAHRIGQTNPVLIHRLVAQNTIEERVLNLQKNKLELATSLLEGTSTSGSITRDDILQLLS